MLGNHFVRTIVVSVATLSFSSCLAPAPDVVMNSGVGISKVNTVTGSAYFKIETARYDKPELKTTKLTCQIFPGDPASKTCTLKIPEEELYYSKFFLTFGVDAGASVNCKVINFTPFAYLGSYSGAFTPPWLFNPSAVDCSRPNAGDKLSSSCYNGAAKEILSSFPDKTFIHFFPDEGVEGTASVSAPYEAGMRYDNTWVTNNLLAANQPTAIAGRYIGTTLTTAGGSARLGDLVWQDWGVACMDEYYEPVYEIKVIISDQDLTTGEDPTSDPTLDDFYDWSTLGS